MPQPVMNENHEALLKTALRLESDQFLPKNIVDLYWKFERTLRRLHCNVSVEALALMCILIDRPTPEAPVSFLDSDATRGDRVLAKLAGDWRWGNYVGVKNKQVIVTLDSGEDHLFSPVDVRIPTREEIVEVFGNALSGV